MWGADLYIILMALLGSILLYPNGNLRYIDALFFGSGAATQGGLNTSVTPVSNGFATTS